MNWYVENDVLCIKNDELINHFLQEEKTQLDPPPKYEDVNEVPPNYTDLQLSHVTSHFIQNVSFYLIDEFPVSE